MVHYTYTMSIYTGITAASQAPIGTLLSHSVTPTLPPRYRPLNASITTPTQTPSGTPGGPSSSGNSRLDFIPTLPQPPLGGISRPLPAALIPVALFRRSHQITRFLLVDNSTKEV
jgi:hypothetical protein